MTKTDKRKAAAKVAKRLGVSRDEAQALVSARLMAQPARRPEPARAAAEAVLQPLHEAQQRKIREAALRRFCGGPALALTADWRSCTVRA